MWRTGNQALSHLGRGEAKRSVSLIARWDLDTTSLSWRVSQPATVFRPAERKVLVLVVHDIEKFLIFYHTIGLSSGTRNTTTVTHLHSTVRLSSCENVLVAMPWKLWVSEKYGLSTVWQACWAVNTSRKENSTSDSVGVFYLVDSRHITKLQGQWSEAVFRT